MPSSGDLLQVPKNVLALFDVAAMQSHAIADSHSSVVYNLTLTDGRRVIIKRSVNREKFDKEVGALKTLHDHPLVPRLLDTRHDSMLGSFIMMSTLNGISIERRASVSNSAARDLGRALAKIHCHPMNSFEGHGSWGEMLLANFRQYIGKTEGLLKSKTSDWALEFFLSRIERLPSPINPVLVHFDLRPGNILTFEGHITGIIDFESIRGGHGSMDFYKLWSDLICSSTLRKSFCDGYSELLPMDFDPVECNILYSIYHAVAGIAWCNMRKVFHDGFYYRNRNLIYRLKKRYHSL